MFQADILHKQCTTQQGFAVFSFRHLWQELSDIAECSINFGKPAVWEAAQSMRGCG